MFWVFTIALFFPACLFVIVPLWRGRNKENRDNELRKDANISLFYEREADLKAEFDAGNLGQRQYDQLIAELQHALLSDVSSVDETP